MVRTRIFLPLLLLAVAVALLSETAPAFAHAEYESSTPARDQVAQAAPSRVDVLFTQEMARVAGEYFLRVFNDQQTQVSQGDGQIDDLDRTLMFTTMPTDVPPGRYIVRWLNLSDEDGDSDEGAYCFYVAVQPTPEQQAECAAFAEEEGPAPSAGAASPTAGAVASATQAETGPTATPADATEDGDDDGGSNVALIVTVIVVGALVVLAAVAGVAFWLRRTLQ
jgi:methionine-rich copper-binding protein CopC